MTVLAPKRTIWAFPRQVRPAHGQAESFTPLTTAFDSTTVAPAAMDTL